MATQSYQESGFEDKDETVSVGIGGFTALVRLTDTYIRTIELPTSYLEDGTHIMDQIILNPVEITITGDVSDIHIPGSSSVDAVEQDTQNIGEIGQYKQEKSPSQQKINDDIIDSDLDDEDSDNQYTASEGLQKSNQTEFADHMKSLQDSKSLFSIEMPDRTYKNMAMASLELDYDNEGNSTGFTIVASQLRFAITKTEAIAKNPSAGLGGQTKSDKDKGTQEPKEDPGKSFLSYLIED